MCYYCFYLIQSCSKGYAQFFFHFNIIFVESHFLRKAILYTFCFIIIIETYIIIIKTYYKHCLQSYLNIVLYLIILFFLFVIIHVIFQYNHYNKRSKVQGGYN